MKRMALNFTVLVAVVGIWSCYQSPSKETLGGIPLFCNYATDEYVSCGTSDNPFWDTFCETSQWEDPQTGPINTKYYDPIETFPCATVINECDGNFVVPGQVYPNAHCFITIKL